jgi:hypothetical protein
VPDTPTLFVTAILAVGLGAAGLLEPRLEAREKYGETFTFVADLDDGTYVHLQLAVSNLGRGDGKGACRALVVEPDGHSWSTASTTASDGWSYSATPVTRLDVGECQATAQDSLTVDVTFGDGRASLSFRNGVHRTQPPDNLVRDGEDSYWYEILVPWTTTHAVLRLPGQPEREANGRGYADHSRTTMLPRQLARSWVRYRGLGEGRPELMLARLPPGDGPWQGWHWNIGDAGPSVLTHLDLAETSGGWSATATAADGDSVVYETTKLLSRFAPLSEHAVLQELARPIVGNPVTLTWRARARRGADVLGEGIMEVTQNL